MKKKVNAKQQREVEEKLRAALIQMGETWKKVIDTVKSEVNKHCDTVKIEFGNDPTADPNNWDEETQYAFYSLAPEETTETVIRDLYYLAAAREEIKRKPLIVKVRMKVEEEIKKPSERKVLYDAHLENGGILTNEQVKYLAKIHDYSIKNMQNNYREWKEDFQKYIKLKK